MGGDAFLGFDEGQSGTRAIAVTEIGETLAVSFGKPASPRRMPSHQVAEVWGKPIRQILTRIQEENYSLRGAAFGLSSLNWDFQYPSVRRVIDQIGLACPVYLFGDVFAALRASLPDGIGITVVAGTGSGVIGRSADQRIFHTFGSSILGDGGGAWALIQRTIEAVARAYLGETEPTTMTESLLELSGKSSTPDLIQDYVENSSKYVTPKFVHAVFSAYDNGDYAASEIITAISTRYAANVFSVARRLSLTEFSVSLCGKLMILPTSPFAQLASHYIHAEYPLAQIYPFDGLHAVGAALSAIDQHTFSTLEAVRLRSITSSSQWLEKNSHALS